jgi:hypothetical protein
MTAAGCTNLMTQALGMTADGIVHLVGTTASVGQTVSTVTAANVTVVLNALILGATGTVKANAMDKPKFMVSSDVFDSYLIASGAQTAISFNPEQVPTYLGYEIIRTPYMPANTAWFLNTKNIHVGTWLGDGNSADEPAIGALNMLDRDGTRGTRYYAYWKFGVTIGIPSEVIYFTIS